jgi:hypothetical protein
MPGLAESRETETKRASPDAGEGRLVFAKSLGPVAPRRDHHGRSLDGCREITVVLRSRRIVRSDQVPRVVCAEAE